MRSLVLLDPDEASVAVARTRAFPLLLLGPDPSAVALLSHPYDEYVQVDHLDAGELGAVCSEVLRGRDLGWLVAHPDEAPLSADQAREWLDLPRLPIEVVSGLRAGPVAGAGRTPAATARPTPTAGT